MALAGESDADDAVRRRRHEQWSERAVDIAVGDVDEALALGGDGEAGPQRREVAGDRPAEGGEAAVEGAGHRVPPGAGDRDRVEGAARARRSAAMPSAAARRAAASLESSSRATSRYGRSAR